MCAFDAGEWEVSARRGSVGVNIGVCGWHVGLRLLPSLACSEGSAYDLSAGGYISDDDIHIIARSGFSHSLASVSNSFALSAPAACSTIMYAQTLSAPLLRVSSPLSPRPVPSICISPAADVPIESPPEPSSPESNSSRSTHLLPPPSGSPLRRPSSGKVQDKRGLDELTFRKLVERAAKRSVSPADRLRREVVVKAHHNKQVERRALFLSRIVAPPSPGCTETAATPPESPAIFHFSLPSPGLASPLELFETVTSRETWVEQVDYKKAQRPARLPSLDQITARLRPVNPAVPSIVIDKSPVAETLDEKPRCRVPAAIFASTRARSASPPAQTPVTPTPTTPDTPSQLIISASPPKSIKPVLVPQSIPALRIAKHMGAELAPVPVMSWRDREAARSALLPSARTAQSWRREAPATAPIICEHRSVQGRQMLDKLRRRTSAPAELQGTMRKGVPVGGF
ncbi:hypothetical protein CTheo_1546 [Ceratobasidium theobromae]|uniref:Uncharacterized protein n=1 Tax=Ceratobasidium theobromae TaxID=1582974 RepID=A0A5N5QTJ1_9AGAM|nr:hypothetical protein CTheo_1546 [Ceratobasidium theobromae]